MGDMFVFAKRVIKDGGKDVEVFARAVFDLDDKWYQYKLQLSYSETLTGFTMTTSHSNVPFLMRKSATCHECQFTTIGQLWKAIDSLKQHEYVFDKKEFERLVDEMVAICV